MSAVKRVAPIAVLLVPLLAAGQAAPAGSGGSFSSNLISIPSFAAGKPAAGGKVFQAAPGVASVIPAGMSGCWASLGTATTADAVFSIQRRPAGGGATQFGTLTFSAGQTVGVFASSAAQSVAATDTIVIVAPGSQDATLADVSITLMAARQTQAFPVTGVSTSSLSIAPNAWNGNALASVAATSGATVVGGVAGGGTDVTISTVWSAWAFSLASATEIGSVAFYVKSSGSLTATSTLAAYLYTDNAGVPGTNISDTSTGQPTIIHGGDVGASYGLVTFRLPKTGLSTNTVYWVVLKAGVSGGNFVFDTAAAAGNFLATAPDSSGSPGAWTGQAKTVNGIIYGSSGRALYGYSPNHYGVMGDGGAAGFGGRFFGAAGPGSKSDSVDNYGAGGTTTYGVAGVRGSGVYGFGGQFISDNSAGAQIQTLANGQVGAQLVANDAAALQTVNLTAGGISAQGLDSTFAVKWQVAAAGDAVFNTVTTNQHVITSNVTNGTTTPANITGLSWAVAASKEYGFHCVLTHQGTATSGPRFNLTGPASPTLVNIRWHRATSPTADTISNDTAFSAAAQTAAITGSGDTTVLTTEVDGVIVNGANAGTAQFMLTSSTSGQTVTVYRGSYCDVR